MIDEKRGILVGEEDVGIVRNELLLLFKRRFVYFYVYGSVDDKKKRDWWDFF